jgi:3-hydroxyisobutyryl-CoA hydrolase
MGFYRCFKFETAEEIMDALKSDNTEFAANTAKAILKRSPTCTKINAENFNRAPNMSFIDIVKLEYMLWSTIIVSWRKKKEYINAYMNG